MDDILMLRKMQSERTMPTGSATGESARRWAGFGMKQMEGISLTSAPGVKAWVGKTRTMGDMQIDDASNYKALAKSGVKSIDAPTQALLTLEAARTAGNVPAMNVASAMAQHPSMGMSNQELVTGFGNPNATAGSSTASRQDAEGASPSARAASDPAREHRRKSYGKIFQKLRSIIQSEDRKKEILSGPGGEALVNLASKFDKWLNAKMPAMDPKNPSSEANALVAELFAFLKAFNG